MFSSSESDGDSDCDWKRRPRRNTQPTPESTPGALGLAGPHPYHGDGGDRRAQERLCQHLRVTSDTQPHVFLDAVHHYLREPERRKEHLKCCIQLLGFQRVIRLLVASNEIMQSGGMDTSARDRKRTKGGTFYAVMKTAVFIRDSEHREIALHEKETRKAESKEQRNHGRKEGRANRQRLSPSRAMERKTPLN